jgi:hypothetical protein
MKSSLSPVESFEFSYLALLRLLLEVIDDEQIVGLCAVTSRQSVFAFAAVVCFVHDAVEEFAI